LLRLKRLPTYVNPPGIVAIGLGNDKNILEFFMICYPEYDSIT